MGTSEYDPTQAPQLSQEAVNTDLLIDNLSYQDARDYVMKFLVAEKKTEALLRAKQQELDKWNERLAFAESKGLSDQGEEAKRHLHSLVQEKTTLTAELETLRRKNIVLKEKLQYKAKTAGISSTKFAEQLLESLAQMVDVDTYKLDEAMREQEALDELAKLKAKLNQGKSC